MEKTKALEEKRKLLDEIDTLKRQHHIDLQEVTTLYTSKLEELSSKSEEFRRLSEELKLLLLRREADVKILQEKLVGEQRYKNNQIEFSQALCNISDQVMHLLQKMEKKI